MLARLPYEWRIEVRFDAPLEEIRRRVSPTLAELTEDGDGTRLELGADSLEWAAGLLAGIGADFTVIRPDELRGELAELSQRLERAAGQGLSPKGTVPPAGASEGAPRSGSDRAVAGHDASRPGSPSRPAG